MQTARKGLISLYHALAGLDKPLKHGFQGFVSPLNQSVTNRMVWRRPTGETLNAD